MERKREMSVDLKNEINSFDSSYSTEEGQILNKN